MRQSSVSRDGRAVSRARVGGNLRWDELARRHVEARTRAIQDQALAGLVVSVMKRRPVDVVCRCRCMLCQFPLQFKVRDQRCARCSLSWGTRSKDVDSVLAVASVVRTVVLGV
jgi:hypothetical protein